MDQKTQRNSCKYTQLSVGQGKVWESLLSTYSVLLDAVQYLHLSHLICTTTLRSVIIPIFLLRKMKSREVNENVQV